MEHRRKQNNMCVRAVVVVAVVVVDYVLTYCLLSWAQLYFLAWYLISVILCINLFVALILEVSLLMHRHARSCSRSRKFCPHSVQ